MARKQTSGVYQIIHRPTGRTYVGSSARIERRWSSHRSKMRCGTHESHLLQTLANTDGVESFVFSILELVPAPLLKEREQHWIDALRAADPVHGLNRDPRSDTSRGRKATAEQRAKIARAVRGRQHSEETKRKLSVMRMGNQHAAGSHYHGKLTEDDVRQILHRAADGESRSDLATAFGVSDATIGRIVKRVIWWRVEIPTSIEAKLVDYRTQLNNRFARGEYGRRTKLNRDDIRRIRSECAGGRKVQDVAAEYGVTPAYISSIKLRRTWKHVA